MSKRILLAEDSSVIQNLTKRILKQQHYSIKGVKNGEEVLKALSKENYDLVLLDIHMPKMDGMTCAREIRNSFQASIKNVPIIAITGNGQNYSDEEFEAAGINNVLPKPIDYDRMVQLINTYVAHGN